MGHTLEDDLKINIKNTIDVDDDVIITNSDINKDKSVVVEDGRANLMVNYIYLCISYTYLIFSI